MKREERENFLYCYLSNDETKELEVALAMLEKKESCHYFRYR